MVVHVILKIMVYHVLKHSLIICSDILRLCKGFCTVRKAWNITHLLDESMFFRKPFSLQLQFQNLAGCCLFEWTTVVTVILYYISFEFVCRQPVAISSSSARLKGFLLTCILSLKRYISTVITSPPQFLLQT